MNNETPQFEKIDDAAEHVRAEEIVNRLIADGYNYVYINEKTGRYMGEKALVDFAIGLRQACYCLDNTDDILYGHDDLVKTMTRCLENKIELSDVRQD